MSTVVADLHVHTTRSDGAVSPSALAAVANEAGLEAVAITDHERLPPWSEPCIRKGGVDLISGIELRVESSEFGRVDLLGYGVSPTDELSTRLEELQLDRIRRAQRMIELLEDELDIDLDIDVELGIGRPHLATAVSTCTDLSYQAVFDRYIGTDCPCYVPRNVPTFSEGRRMLQEAASIVVLAHPLRYTAPQATLSLAESLDGIEVFYPYDEDSDRSLLEAFLSENDCIQTGGSDAHTVGRIGSCGLDKAHYSSLEDQLRHPMD